MPQFKTASTRTAKRRDKLARWVITFGGVTVIASVVAILALTVSVAIGLFRARANVVGTCRLGGPSGAAVSGGAAHGVEARAAGGLEAHPTDGGKAYPTDGLEAYPTDGVKAYPKDGLEARPTGPAGRRGQSSAPRYRPGSRRGQRDGLRLVRQRERCLAGPADRQSAGTAAHVSARRPSGRYASPGRAAGQGKILARLVRRRSVAGRDRPSAGHGEGCLVRPSRRRPRGAIADRGRRGAIADRGRFGAIADRGPRGAIADRGFMGGEAVGDYSGDQESAAAAGLRAALRRGCDYPRGLVV